MEERSERYSQEKDRSKLHSHVFGLLSEFLVCVHLFLKGYKIHKRRFKTGVGEVDIIASRGKILTFIEVKARSDKNVSEVISSSQMKRIANAARYYITKNSSKKFETYRIDLIIFHSALSVKHIENAWEI